MSWEAIGALSSLIGAAGVAASLFYLAVQVRSGAEELRRATRDSVYDSVTDWAYHVMSDPELAWIFETGCRDTTALPEKERARWVLAAYSFFKAAERIYLRYLEGNIEESVWVINQPLLYAYARLPCARTFLAKRHEVFDRRFLQFLLDSALDETPARHPIGESADIPCAATDDQVSG